MFLLVDDRNAIDRLELELSIVLAARRACNPNTRT